MAKKKLEKRVGPEELYTIDLIPIAGPTKKEQAALDKATKKLLEQTIPPEMRT